MAAETLVQPPRTMMEVFNSLPEGTYIQLIENNLVMSPAPLDMHQYILGEVFGELRSFLKKTKAGTIRVAPYDVYLDDRNAYQPDICIILNERLSLIKKNGLYGAPNLVVEVLSLSTAKYDLNEKKSAYERFGVTEYWIIDPEDYTATGYFLAGDEYHEFFKEVGVIESKLLDCAIEF